ncbi:DUF2332 domain-containing protein [Nocardioides sp. JQ2195]|uniref:DUF2332 domain-containing protein n=1 Tax=Nocardioides sp. JQ2195 TaxID=2592334 RepID=UPI00143EE88C|nr:DUF2332 domain-containing protein [Nocardioides sp. JQ2195]QIX28362.1 DUF2332 domain-containing protein [Nocardioides sp. JQ2195]
MEPYAEVVESYSTFALEAKDSACFVEWSLGVADDREVQDLIRTLPPVKQQPNLVFAAARWHGAPAPGPYAGFRRTLLELWDAVRATILVRSTQTNEVGRLATLLPAFAGIDGFSKPLALIEVGASAGLNLFPDRFRFTWARPDGTTHQLGDGPELACRLRADAPLPERLPQVVARAGIDLNPLDVSDPDAMAWLTNLVFPEQEERRARLRRAIAIAAAEPPDLVRGNLLEELPAMLDAMPAEATAVVFHSAVIAYLEEGDRRRFAAMMADLVATGRCRWVSNEGGNVLPEITSTGPSPTEPCFVLGIDGRSVAFTHGHGAWLDWH